MTSILNTLPPESHVRLRALITEVLRVNEQFNLTAVREPEAAWVKHILDPLQALPTGFFEARQSVLDVGSGPGFPGLPLLMARPDLRLTCLDSTRKKCDFIRDTAAKFDLPVKIICDRAETIGQNVVWRERYDIATCRAVGKMSEVAELCLPLVKPGGHVLLWRGESAPSDLKLARSAIGILGGRFQEIRPYNLPDHDTKYHLIVLEKVSRTPKLYPRRIGVPRQQPL